MAEESAEYVSALRDVELVAANALNENLEINQGFRAPTDKIAHGLRFPEYVREAANDPTVM
jgi:hypothetical protein